MTRTKVIGGAMIFCAVLAWGLLMDAHGAEAPALAFATVVDPAAGPPALTIERDGDKALSMTVYDDAGPVAVIFPDGTVEVKKGTPEQAARLFFNVFTRIRCNE